jgi:hypothetical protein
MSNIGNGAESKQSPPTYTIMSPENLFRGKSYLDWIQDWSNWFYQPYPERDNNGDMVFLRSMPLAEGNYQNEPLVVIGNDSLEITAEQGILIPIITSTIIADEFESPEWMYGKVRNDIRHGDDPPNLENIRINGEKLVLRTKDQTYENLELFEFETPVYSLHLPDAADGPSLKGQVEMPSQSSGYFPAVTRGYFVILMPTPNQEYYIECRGTGAQTPRGPYHVSFFYHIFVNKNKQRNGSSSPPRRLRKNIAIAARDKNKRGELHPDEWKMIRKYLEIEGETDEEIDEFINRLKNVESTVDRVEQSINNVKQIMREDKRNN